MSRPKLLVGFLSCLLITTANACSTLPEDDPPVLGQIHEFMDRDESPGADTIAEERRKQSETAKPPETEDTKEDSAKAKQKDSPAAIQPDQSD